MAPLPPSESVGPSRAAQLLCGAHEGRQPARARAPKDGPTMHRSPRSLNGLTPQNPHARVARPAPASCAPQPPPTPQHRALVPRPQVNLFGNKQTQQDSFERTSGRPQDTLTRLEPSPRPCREGNPESLWRPGSAHGPRHTDRIAAGQQSSVALARRVRGLVHSSAPAA